MVKVVHVVALFLLAATTAVAGEPAPAFHTQFEARQAFFGIGKITTGPVFAEPQDQLLPTQDEKKSVGLAVLYSLLLPGMGELYAGSFKSGRFFLVAEGALWLTYAGFDIYGTSIRTDARSFAKVHSGLDPSGKNDQFYVDVGNFLSVDEYNEKKLRDRTPELVYDPAAGYAWQWDSDANRSTFRELRVSSDNVLNNMRFVVAALIVNHVASAINAARLAVAHNAALSAPLGDLQIGAGVMGGLDAPHGIVLTVVKGF